MGTTMKELPKTLTHYTRLDVLESIVTNGLRASNILYLNDGLELKLAIEIGKGILRQFVEDRPKMHYAYGDDIEEGLKDEGLPSFFATSFCTEDDLLSQWRGYGGDSQGVSITFDSIELKDIFHDVGGVPSRVVYDLEIAQAKLYNTLDVALTDWDELLGRTSLTPAEIAASVILPQAPQFKHEGFAEEGEWRFIITRAPLDLTGIGFFSRRGLLVPYLLVASNNLPITHITIGPSRHQQLNKQSVELLLRKYGYSDVEVQLSTVPYRS